MPGEFRGLSKELPSASNEKNRQTVNVNGLNIDIYRLVPFIDGMETQSFDVDSLTETDKDAKYFTDANGNGLSLKEIIEEYRRTPDFDEIIKNHPEWRGEIERVKKADYTNHPIIFLEHDLLDGAHRLTKALIDGVKEVRAKRLSKEYIERNIEHVKFLE